MLLDLTAAVDTDDHSILISCLDYCVGLKGTALERLESYLLESVLEAQLLPLQHSMMEQTNVTVGTK